MKAKIGVKKRFNIINEKKSIIINAFKSAFFLLEIMRDDEKLKHKKVIKNLLLKRHQNTWAWMFWVSHDVGLGLSFDLSHQPQTMKHFRPFQMAMTWKGKKSQIPKFWILDPPQRAWSFLPPFIKLKNMVMWVFKLFVVTFLDFSQRRWVLKMLGFHWFLS